MASPNAARRKRSEGEKRRLRALRDQAEADLRNFERQPASDQSYARVGDEWLGIPSSEVTGPADIATAHDLLRHITRKAWAGGITEVNNLNRRTYLGKDSAYGSPTIFVNLSYKGWPGFVHDLSHVCHKWLYPDDLNHCVRHRDIERKMARRVITARWQDKLLQPRQPRSKP